MKKSANGYYKFYNKEGISCRIKCTDVINGTALIKFKHRDEPGWLYHSPERKFGHILEAVNFVLKNLENTGMIFKIIPLYKEIK